MFIRDTKVIHRRYPDRQWDYKAISMSVKDNGIMKHIIYYTLIDKGIKKEGVEMYQGENYIVGSKDRSYSRIYTINNFPKKYKQVVKKAIEIHKKTEWSDAEYVNMN